MIVTAGFLQMYIAQILFTSLALANRKCFKNISHFSDMSEACSSRDPILRVDCGFYGINKTTCQGKGCCYDNSVGGGVPWCFNKPDTSSPDYGKLWLVG